MNRRRGLALLLPLLVAATVGLTLAGCQSSPAAPAAPSGKASPSPQNTPSTKASPSPQSTTKKQPDLLNASEKAVYNDLEITLLSAKVTRDYVNSPQQGSKYIVLRFKTKNIGKEEESGNVSRSLQWRDKDGTRRTRASSTGVKLNNPADDDLAPGAEAQFEEVYDVPESLTEVEFHYVPGSDPIEKARWTLKIE